MNDEQLFINCYEIGKELLKNAAKAYGIDFKRLNLTMVELDIRMKRNKQDAK